MAAKASADKKPANVKLKTFTFIKGKVLPAEAENVKNDQVIYVL